MKTLTVFPLCHSKREAFPLTNGFKNKDLLLSPRRYWKQSFVVYSVATGSLF